MKPRRIGAAIALAAGLFTLPLAADLRLRRSVQPLSGRWRDRPVEPRGSALLGVSFRPPQVDAMGLDPASTLRQLLDYPLHVARLGAYWSRIEPRPGRFAFQEELDWQIDAVERAGKQIILCVGALKTFGYPEFFVPPHYLPQPLAEGKLVRPAEHATLLDAAKEFVTRVVERYRDRASILAWQVEHEAVDPLGMEHSWRLAEDFVATEVVAVRQADPRRPILLNGFLPTSLLGGAQQWWRTRDQGDSLAAAIRLADIVGLDFYPTLGLLRLGPLTLYLDGSNGPWPRRVRERLIAQARGAGRRVMVSEGQAEPWETITTPPDPTAGAMASCPPERLIDNYNVCIRWLHAAEPFGYLFWGAEYWVARDQSGDPSYLGAFARVLENA
jgi:hypothetical protein